MAHELFQRGTIRLYIVVLSYNRLSFSSQECRSMTIKNSDAGMTREPGKIDPGQAR